MVCILGKQKISKHQKILFLTLDNDHYTLKFAKYYIIGLNALNGCERKFFTYLQRHKKAEFLWDYDQAYLNDKNNEAGRFMRKNLKDFPSPEDFYFNTSSFNQKKK